MKNSKICNPYSLSKFAVAFLPIRSIVSLADLKNGVSSILCSTAFLMLLSGCTGAERHSDVDPYGFSQMVTLSSKKLASSTLINKAASLHLFGNYLFVY